MKIADGMVGGTGVWPSSLTNLSILAPGDSSGSIGTFTVDGSYDQTDAGSLIVELGGSAEGEFDVLKVGDTARVGGTLEIKRLGGFEPQTGAVFEIVRAARVEGMFDTVVAEDTGVDVLYEEGVIKVIVTSGVAAEQVGEVPADFSLHQNYPNPFNPTTTISYALPATSDVRLTVVDVLGRQVSEITSGTQPPGTYEISFDASGIPSGIYFYQLQAGDYVETRRMVVAK